MRRVPLTVCLMLACSVILGACDDALDNPSEAAVSISLNNHATLNCPVLGRDSVPEDPEVQRLNPSTSDEAVAALPRVIQGTSGQEIECAVKQTAPSAYNVNVRLKADGRVFALVGSVAASAGTGARVDWLSPKLSATMTSSACTLDVDEQREGGGAIRLTYDCPDFRDPSQPDSACAASGSVVLERCDD